MSDSFDAGKHACDNARVLCKITSVIPGTGLCTQMSHQQELEQSQPQCPVQPCVDQCDAKSEIRVILGIAVISFTHGGHKHHN